MTTAHGQRKSLTPDPRNANRGTVRGLGAVEHSLQQFGAGRSILASADGIILAGNKTYDRAVELGIPIQEVESDGKTLFVIRRTDLAYDDPRAKELAIADNRSSEVGLEWDADVLTALADDGVDLSQFWFEDELADLLAADDEPTEGLTDPDDVPDVPDEPITKPGDLWLLGRHRLMCGDSTNVTDVDRLMDGAKADMVFTDPPYNAAFNGRSGRHQVIRNDDLPEDEFDQFLTESINMLYVTAPDAPKYVCTDWKMYPALYRKMQKPSACIVWVKNMWGMGNGYRHQHEFVVFEGQLEANDQSDVWEIKRDNGADYEHPTQKPTALAERAINNSSKRGDIVLDLFGGSGSTLIACEQTGRDARLMELDPHYVDVICRRFFEFTGIAPVREGDGVTWGDMAA